MSPFFLSPTTAIINVLLPTLISLIPDDIMATAMDKLLDSIEDAIAKSPTAVDDAIVLPVIFALRQKLNVPDND